ncbi:hypothetical protein ABNN70_09185 [Sporolactobacillus sp. Y61]|uniref:Nudix hydrolase domain-containing protein n=1 Tax=Sporolactobacillus sp. Y61 TaxID=3160863 RepID=A0AAU8ICG1_9BACL|nr:hypothetical protein [Sporolactobacillus sp. THM19-2]RYL90295.1 hypothetical protein EWH91_10075 [Sporolactobacillus sp. THM19-2]
MGKMDEQIIVVNRALLFTGNKGSDLTFQGTEQSGDSISEMEHNMARHYQVMRRGDAEENPEYKQPIPYAVLHRGNHFFTYTRLGGGGEKRLHGRLSVGVGGHMNQAAGADDFHQVLNVNLRREIDEELNITGVNRLDLRTIGLINDDATEVGRVHIGVLISIELPDSATVSVREKDKLAGAWMTLDELTAKKEKMESWSVFAVDVLSR